MKEKVIVSAEKFRQMTSSEIVQVMEKDKSLWITEDNEGQRQIVKQKVN